MSSGVGRVPLYERLRKTLPQQMRFGYLLIAAIMLGADTWIATGILSGSILGSQVRGATSGGLIFGAFGVFFAWWATRFRIALDASVEPGRLVLTGRWWSAALSPAEVERVTQLHADPYRRPWLDDEAWRVWVRVDGVRAGARKARFLVWSPEPQCLLEKARKAGFPVEGLEDSA
jgi:hypothetical protein